MNERIRELWEQANIRYSVHETLKPRDERKTIPDIFAELIVRECIDCIDGSPTTEENTLILSKYFIIGNLKKHFGVKNET